MFRNNKSKLFNLARVVWWLVLTPISYLMGWLSSVVFVALLSIWALVESAWAAYEASNDKIMQKKLDKVISQNEEILSKLDQLSRGK